MDEKQAIDRVMNVLTEHNLRQGTDYIFRHMSHGCFNIALCPHRYAVLDIEYFYDNIPDIKIFKIQQKKDYVNIILKIKLRGC